MAYVLALSFACWLGSAATAWAGPVELLGAVEVAAQRPERVAVRWLNGEGGIFVSSDRGDSFQITCFGAVSNGLQGRGVQGFRMLADGSLCVGTGQQVFCSDDQICSWTEATEMKGKWIADFATDPLDPNVLYLATGTANQDNGLYVRARAGEVWKPLGLQSKDWVSRVHVVKTDAGKRFYVSAQENVEQPSVDGGPPAIDVRYYVRHSDDDGATWTSHYYGPVTERTNLRLAGVDPTDPDRVVVVLLRSAEQAPDELWFSAARGEPDSFSKIGEVTEFSGLTFAPDGTLYYGDNDQGTPGLYQVAGLGEPPSKLTASYKVGCIGFDPASDRLLVCADWRFGSVDRATGELSMLFDINRASDFLECPGQGALQDQCASAFRPPNFCDQTHYASAPVCTKFFGTSTSEPSSGSAGSSGSAAGTSASPPEAGSGDSGAAGGRAKPPRGSAKPRATASKPAGDGCSVVQLGSAAAFERAIAVTGVLSLFAGAGLLARPRRRTRDARRG